MKTESRFFRKNDEISLALLKIFFFFNDMRLFHRLKFVKKTLMKWFANQSLNMPMQRIQKKNKYVINFVNFRCERQKCKYLK